MTTLRLFDGARTVIAYAALGALCAVTSLAGASAASWSGPPTQLEVDTVSVLRANYAAGSTLILPPLSPGVIDSARQDAGAPAPDLNTGTAPLARDLSESDPTGAAALQVASESARELMLVRDTQDEGLATAGPLPAPSRGTAAVADAATPAVAPTTVALAVEPRVADSKAPVAELPTVGQRLVHETLPAVAEVLNPVLQPVVDLLAPPLEPVAPLLGDVLAPLIEPGSTPLELPVALPIELPAVPSLPELPLLGGLFR